MKFFKISLSTKGEVRPKFLLMIHTYAYHDHTSLLFYIIQMSMCIFLPQRIAILLLTMDKFINIQNFAPNTCYKTGKRNNFVTTLRQKIGDNMKVPGRAQMKLIFNDFAKTKEIIIKYDKA